MNEFNNTESDSGEAQSPQRLRVVIADDNADSVEALATVVRTLGHIAIVARDGAQAVALAELDTPDVMFVSIAMPILNGYQVCSEVRALPRGHKIFLVALTGWNHEEIATRIRNAGFDYHLVKTFDPVQLEELLLVRQRGLSV